MSSVTAVTEKIRRFTVRCRPSGPWRSRALLGGVVATCIVVTAVAVTGADSSSAGMKFAQSGHLTYNAALGKVFRIDGASKNADPLVGVRAESGSRVVQTEQDGFVLSRGGITEFGKSDLRVVGERPVDPQEQPIGLESEAGPAFAIYPRAGMVVRFGAAEVTVGTNGSLGRPIVTPDGALWVHVRPTGQLCQLPVTANRLTCVAKIPDGHTGQLTLVGDQAVFVDTTARQLRAVDGDGFGRAATLADVELSTASLIAPNDVAGRVAILEAAGNELHLVDAAPVTTGRPGQPSTSRSLGAGKFTELASSGKGLALIDSSNGGRLVTLDQEGNPQKSWPMPRPVKKSAAAPDERPEIVRGADRRLYVDGDTGQDILVVDDDGEVTEVAAEPAADESDEAKNKDKNKPEPRPSEDPKPTGKPKQPEEPETDRPVAPRETERPPVPREEPDEPRSTERPRQPDKPRETEKPRGTEKPRETGRPRETPKPPQTKKPTGKPTVRAGKPGAPGNVSAQPGNAAATVSWSAAQANGAAVTSYQVSWSGGRRTAGGDARRLSVPGLTPGQSYKFVVRAVNSVGAGPGATSSRVTLRRDDRTADAPVNLRPDPGAGQIRLTWQQPALNGGTLVHYSVQLVPEAQATRTVTTQGTSYTWNGLEDGERYVVRVRAVTSTGGGPAVNGQVATTTATAGEFGSGQVSISQGSRADYDDTTCPQPENCYWTDVSARGLQPNTTYRLRAYADNVQIHNDGYTRRSDSDGNFADNMFHNSFVGRRIRVSIELDGTTIWSNTITWQER